MFKCIIEGCSSTAKTQDEFFDHLRTEHRFDNKAIARYMAKLEELHGAPKVMRFNDRLHINGNGVLMETRQNKPMFITTERNAWLHSHLEALKDELNGRFSKLENGDHTKQIVKEALNGTFIDKLENGVRAIAKQEIAKETIAPQVVERLDKLEEFRESLIEDVAEYIKELKQQLDVARSEIDLLVIETEKLKDSSKPTIPFEVMKLRDFIPKEYQQNKKR